ncbi:anti-sigma factor [Microbacterium galbinum]|uniref:Regulator of SigK n=1 Tax=Microbacterium galbinum TaxID=2851646 RepID=A0ABY4IL37_9MICO|nr:anti-sigma factor [Microbacterium galbinum]UPL13342.1 anti-sigma factor [Microbacterium galbinum]
MNEKDFAELAAGAALHALSPEDEARFRRTLDEHPEWERIVEADAATAATLSAPFTGEVPRPDIRAALLSQIAHTPQVQGAQTPQDGRTDDEQAAPAAASSGSADTSTVDSIRPPRRWSRAIFALAACLALLVGVGIGSVALNDYLNRPASVVALEQITGASDAAQASVTLDDGTTATAHWSASLGSAVLVTDGLAAPADGKTYEMWFVRGETPVPAGVFDADGTTATAVLSGSMHEGDVIAVTVEEEGGSPSGLPTTDPIIAIPTA